MTRRERLLVRSERSPIYLPSYFTFQTAKRATPKRRSGPSINGPAAVATPAPPQACLTKRSKYAFRTFATFGATTIWQYGWFGLFA